MTLFRYSLFSSLFALDTAGRSNTEREPVNAVGKKIKGKAMPFRIPYWLRAMDFVRPDCCRVRGTKVASKLCNRLIISRWKVRGSANNAMSERPLLCNDFEDHFLPLHSEKSKDTTLTMAEAISPITNTNTASSQEKLNP